MKTQIDIPVAQLKAALPGLTKIIPRSSTLPVLACINVAVSPDGGTTSLQAHNLDEIATFTMLNSSPVPPGQMLVPTGPLSNLVKGCPADGVIHLINEGEQTRIRYPVAGSMVERQLNYVDIKEWPEVKQVNGDPVELDVAFKQALKEALDSASSDSSRYVLNGACLDVRGSDGHHVIGTDGRHLYSANSFRFNLPEPLVVRSHKFVVWPGFMNDGPWKLRMHGAIRPKAGDTKVKEEGPWLEISSDHWTYTAKAIEGNYPNWKQVMPVDTSKWTRLVLAPEAIQAMQTALPTLPGSELTNKTVTMDVTRSGLTLRARGNQDEQDTVIRIPDVRVTGDPVQIALNRVYLLKALKCGLSDLRIENSLSPLVFTSPSKTMIIMPVRLEAPAPPAKAAEAPAEAPAPVPIPEPQTNVSPAPPSADEEVHFKTESAERKNDMSQETVAAPARGNLKAHNNGNGTEAESTTVRNLIEKVENIKGSLRQVITDLSETVSMLKNVEKENKVTSKEIASVRQTLRSLQSVEI